MGNHTMRITWALFMGLIVAPAVYFGSLTGSMDAAETFSYINETISGGLGGLIGGLATIPIGLIACLMPDEIYYAVTGVRLFFMDFTVIALMIFFATTYPPSFADSRYISDIKRVFGY